MAERWAVATGNWSSTATWNGGTLPTAADDVYANGFTVTINQDVTVLSIRTTAGTTAVAGGGFSITSNITVNATGSGIICGSTQVISSNPGINNTATINSNIFGSTTVSGFKGSITHTSGLLIINGNLTSGSLSSCFALRNASSGNVQINGNIIGDFTYCVLNASSGTITVTGLVYGGTGSASYGIDNQGIGIINISGNVKGGSGTNSYGVHNSSTGTVNISGLAIGSDMTGGVGVNNASTGIVTVGGLQFGAQGWPPCAGNIVVASLDNARATLEDSTFALRTLFPGGYERYARATGNWSSLSTWDFQNNLPQTTDTVFANNYTVTINQDVNVVSLNTTSSTGISGGGQFSCTTNRTITSNIFTGNTHCLSIGSSSPTVIFNGNVYGSTNGSVAAFGIFLSTAGSGNLTVNGNIFAGNNTNCHGVRVDGNFNVLNVNGTTTGGIAGSGTGYGISVTLNGTLTHNGSVYGGTASNGYGIYCQGSGTSNINGDIFGGSGSSSIGYYLTGTRTSTINGNIFGGLGSNACGLYNISNNATVNVNGHVYGGSGSTAYGIAHISNSPISISGNAYGGYHSTAYALHNSASAVSGAILLSGIAISSNTTPALNNEQPSGYISIGTAQHSPSGMSPWTQNGKIFFSPLSVTNFIVNNSSGNQTTLGRVGG